MAGDYIPWVKGLTKRREVIVMASQLGMTRREVAACCMEWWEWCDSEGDFDELRHCHIRGVPFVPDLSQENRDRGVPALSLIDSHVGVPGFGQALADVGWAQANDHGDLMHPNLGRWTGSAAKERLYERDRKRNQRAMSRKSRDKCPAKTGTRGEESNSNRSSCHRSTPHDVDVAQSIWQGVLAIRPNHKPPNLNAWANDIRLMREQDGRTHEEIRDLFAWANRDDFWRTNILSPAKLRKQWDQLAIKRTSGKQNTLFRKSDYQDPERSRDL